MGSVNKWANYGKWRHGKKRNELLNVVTKPEDVPDEIMNPILENVARQVKNYENKQPPSPPKDRIFRESSWLETLTFGLYKSKK
jgi:hypothetical protein